MWLNVAVILLLLGAAIDRDRHTRAHEDEPAYVDYGGSGEPLVLVPGLGGCGSLSDVVPLLTPQFRVVVFHLPLKTADNADDYSFRYIATRLASVLDARAPCARAHFLYLPSSRTTPREPLARARARTSASRIICAFLRGGVFPLLRTPAQSSALFQASRSLCRAWKETQELSIERCDVLGESFGGGVAQRFAPAPRRRRPRSHS